MMLHMADNRVLPIRKIECTVGPNFHVGGPKIPVRGSQDMFGRKTFKAAFLILEFILQDSMKPDHVGDQEIVLIFFWEMAA